MAVRSRLALPAHRRIAILGFGNMGRSLARGLLASRAVRPDELWVTATNAERLDAGATGLGCRTGTDNRAAAAWAEVVILAVKPQRLESVVRPIAPVLRKRLVLSLAAGVPTDEVEHLLGTGSRVVRAMPNICVSVREGASAIAPGRHARPEDLAYARDLLGAVGTVVQLEEELMDAVTGLSGTGPMYIFLIIESLSDAGVKMGLSREAANILATQTVLGAAKMVSETGDHPILLKDLVTSPAGTAISALHSLEKTGMRGVLIDAVEVATARSKELGQVRSGAKAGRRRRG